MIAANFKGCLGYLNAMTEPYMGPVYGAVNGIGSFVSTSLKVASCDGNR